MNSIKQKSIKAFAWDFSGRIAGQTVGFIISILLARLLSPSDFGLLAMVNVVIALSGTLIDMGLGIALIQRKDVTEEHYGSVFFFNIVVGLFLTAFLFFAAPLIGAFYQNVQLVPIARTMAFLFLFNSIGNVIRLKLRKDLDYKIPTAANLISAILSGCVGIALAFYHFGVWSLVVQSLINPIISNIYLFYKISWRPQLIFRWHAIKELWSFGFRMFISGIIDTIFSNIDSLIIGKLFNSSTLGHYYRARSLNNYVIMYSSGSIMNVLMPAFSKIHDDLEVFKAVVIKSYHLVCFLAFLLTGFFFITGADIIILLFGPKWEPTIPMFRLIIMTAYGYPLSSVLVNIISAAGNSKAFLKLEIIKKFFFGISMALGFIWGIKGYLIFNVIVYALAVYINIYYAGNQLKTGQKWFLRMTIPYLFITVFLCLFFYIFDICFNTSYLFHLFFTGTLYIFLFIGISRILKLSGLLIILEELKLIYLKRNF